MRESGAVVEVACDLRLRKQYVHGIHAFFGNHRGRHPAARPTAFGVRAETVDGQDVRAVYAAASRLAERARRGEGPAFLLCNTYRYRGHHVGDINREYYRSKKEEQQWLAESDPIKNFAAMAESGEARGCRRTRARLTAELKVEMEKAMKFAIAAPYPGADEVDQDVYA